MTDLNPDPALLTIGAFAALSRLSPKALRLYAELGLLVPARVDDLTGYRYYDPAQVERAALIGLLRQLDLPLADIRTVLDAPASVRAGLLRVRWAALKAELQRREELARYIVHRLEGETPMTYDVQSRFVPAQAVACLTYRVTVNDLSDTIGRGMSALKRFLARAGATPVGVPFVIYHGEVNTDSDGPIEVCQPYEGHAAPSGEVTLRVEPEHHEAFVTLHKQQFHFPAILRAYDATAAYASAHGQDGPLHCRETYPYDWTAATGDGLAGEVAWPYMPKEG